MKYTVVVQLDAVRDIEEINESLRDYSVQAAERWNKMLDQLAASLETFPKRYPLAPESERNSFEVRNVFLGNYRVLYAVRGDAVQIMRIRHAAQKPFKPGELN